MVLANLPEDVRRDLLRAQQGMIGDTQPLPQVKIMAAGAGMYEFTDTNETVREFEGVILGSHARNVLWDRPYGTQLPPGAPDEDKLPVCSSRDGKTGIPRRGFAHAALQGRVATGTESIDCKRCPYNQWGSKGLIPALLRAGAGETAATAKGKAVVNQRAVYFLVQGRQTPVELILPPTSISALDEYLAMLLNRGMPVQAVLTRMSQDVQQRGGLRWAQATFAQGDLLDAAAFHRALETRTAFKNQIEGVVEELVIEPEIVDAAAPRLEDDAQGGEEPLPF
jgi:hypothetical protein